MAAALPNEPETSPDSLYFRAALCLIALGTIFHLAYSTHLELVGDEAYYWLWSRHPDICYLDKGPMVAWLIWVGTALFGQTVLGVRFFAVLLASGTGVAMCLLARRLFSDRAAFWTVVVATVIPLFAVGASLMTIDTVYVFFWAWAALAFWHAQARTSLGPWVLTGILVGLGLLSKYTAAIELISFAAFCVWHRSSRVHLRRTTFWSMVVTALLFLIPAIVWNYREHWPTSDWLLQRGGLDKSSALHPTFIFAFLGEQAGVISPLIFAGLIGLFFRPSLWQKPQPATGYVALLFLPLFGLYLLLGLRYVGPPNWTAGAYVGGAILLAAKWSEFAGQHRWARRVAIAGLVLAGLETAILLETRWLNLPHRLDPLDRARGSRSLATEIAQSRQSTGARFVIADNYMTAALLCFYLPGQPETFVPITKRPLNQLELWPNYDQKYPAGDALIIGKRANLAGSLSQSFAQIVSLGTVQAMDGERTVGSYHLFLGKRRPAAERLRSNSRLEILRP